MVFLRPDIVIGVNWGRENEEPSLHHSIGTTIGAKLTQERPRTATSMTSPRKTKSGTAGRARHRGNRIAL